MFLKNEDVKIGTIPDANGSDNPLKKMEFLTEKEMKDSSRLFGKVIVPPGSALAYHTHEGEGEAYHILQGKGLYNDNGTKYEVHPGDTTFTCDGAGHAIENIGNEDLVFMALILLSYISLKVYTNFGILPGTSLIYLKIYEILVSSFQKYKFHQNQYLLKSSVTPLRSHRSGLHYVHLIQS